MTKRKFYTYSPPFAFLLTGLLGLATVFAQNQGPVPCKAYASTTYPLGQFCYSASITVTNLTASPLTNELTSVLVPTTVMVSSQFMGPGAYDLLLTDSALNEIPLFTQDIESTPGRWWFMIPSLGASATEVFTLYMGSPRAHRGNGFPSNGDSGTWITTAFNAAFDIADNLSMFAVASTTTSHATAAWFLSHYNTGASHGYRLGTIDIAGVKYVRAQVNNQTCDTPWDGSIKNIEATFVNPNLRIYLDDTLVATCNTGLASITANGDAFESGVSATGVGAYTGIVRDVRIMKTISTTPVVVLHWTMEAHNSGGDNIIETIAADPDFTGLIGDASGNGYVGTYHFDSLQGGVITAVMGPISSVPTANPFVGPRNIVVIVTTPFANPTAQVGVPSDTAGNNIPGGSTVNRAIDGTHESHQAVWFTLAAVIAIFLMTVVTRATGFPSVGMIMPGIVFVVFAVLTVISPWITTLYGFTGFGLWSLARVGR